MSNRRYIELYSANRNRNQFPLQSSFEVPFAPTRQLSSGFQSFDALCTGPIFYKWTSIDVSDVSQLFPWPITPAPPNPPPYSLDNVTVGTGSTAGCILLPSASASLSPIPNYYVGYQLYDTVSERRTIIGYDPSNAKFLLDQPFTAVPTDVVLADPSSTSVIHIPSKDVNGNCVRVWSNAYDTCYIVDETKSDQSSIVYAMITSYDYVTQLATLDRPLTGFAPGHVLTVRKTLPQEQYTLTATPVGNNGTFLFYNGIIYNSAVLSSTVGAISVPGMIVTLPANQGNREVNYYAGKYIYNTSNDANPPINGGGIYGLYFIKASYYNSSTGLVELLVDNTPIPRISCNYSQQSPYTQSPNPDFVDIGDIINIVNYIKDNYSPLNYNGSVVSQSETVCYEISLISLTLPNVVLRTGARAAFYPFFYVEFTNTTSPSGSSTSIIYSNSPTSNNALFIAPVTDTQQPLNSSFVKLYSNMSQTVKFKPNDSLRFSVYLPDGRLFETVEQDYLSPYPPNGLLQIDAVFGIRRI